MRLPPLFASLLASALLAACGGGAGYPGAPAPLPIIHVDAFNGSDDVGNGTAELPYKSIRRGIQGADTGAVVQVHPGTYDVANGERFPIWPGIGITIRGTNAFSRGQGVNVVGGGLWSGDPEGRLHATIVPNYDNRIVGLSLSNPQPFVVGGPRPAAALMVFSSATVEACTLRSSDKGVRLMNGATGMLLKDCTLALNVIGVFVDGAGDGNRVEGCLMTNNNAGMFAGTGGVDFGGGPWSSLGGNAFTGNVSNDLVHATDAGDVVYAAGCYWDHVAPTLATGNPASLAEADVWVVGAGTVKTTGAQLYQPFQFPPPPVGPKVGP